jgi:hypothetical protein
MQDQPGITPSELVDVLLRGFERDIAAYPNHQTSLGDWTDSVFRTLRGHGEKLGKEVYCARGAPECGEFMLDLVWFNPSTCRADLAVECEWGKPSDIAYDFEKLL